MKSIKYDSDYELDCILLEAAVHIKLSLEIKDYVLDIYYPLL